MVSDAGIVPGASPWLSRRASCRVLALALPTFCHDTTWLARWFIRRRWRKTKEQWHIPQRLGDNEKVRMDWRWHGKWTVSAKWFRCCARMIRWWRWRWWWRRTKSLDWKAGVCWKKWMPQLPLAHGRTSGGEQQQRMHVTKREMSKHKQGCPMKDDRPPSTTGGRVSVWHAEFRKHVGGPTRVWKEGAGGQTDGRVCAACAQFKMALLEASDVAFAFGLCLFGLIITSANNQRRLRLVTLLHCLLALDKAHWCYIKFSHGRIEGIHSRWGLKAYKHRKLLACDWKLDQR